VLIARSWINSVLREIHDNCVWELGPWECDGLHSIALMDQHVLINMRLDKGIFGAQGSGRTERT
jgi:hypothetical protein